MPQIHFSLIYRHHTGCISHHSKNNFKGLRSQRVIYTVTVWHYVIVSRQYPAHLCTGAVPDLPKGSGTASYGGHTYGHSYHNAIKAGDYLLLPEWLTVSPVCWWYYWRDAFIKLLAGIFRGVTYAARWICIPAPSASSPNCILTCRGQPPSDSLPSCSTQLNWFMLENWRIFFGP